MVQYKKHSAAAEYNQPKQVVGESLVQAMEMWMRCWRRWAPAGVEPVVLVPQAGAHVLSACRELDPLLSWKQLTWLEGQSLGLALTWRGLCLVDTALQLVVVTPAEPGEAFKTGAL